MRYLPHTEDEIRAMLERIGADTVDALFPDVPERHRVNHPLNVEPALDEMRLMAHLEGLASSNRSTDLLSFVGGGMYDHHVPPAVDQLLLRSEFYTAYTPYQAEVSQGTLQAIYEFQTLVCELFGLDVANASLYDAASGLAEAVLMARRVTKRSHCVLSAGLHPQYIETVRTYLTGMDGEPKLDIVPLGADGRTDRQALARTVREDTAVVAVAYPNFFGCVEDLAAVRAAAPNALLVTTTAEPYALSVLAPPGARGADIAVGEGQGMAIAPQFGGPGVGLFACRQKFLRQIPGRLVGQTVDGDGRRGFVLTLSTREQHIRRERATSNICTNHGLVALAFAIRTAMLGRQGFERVGQLCLSRTEYLKARLAEVDGLSLPHAAPTFNEFVVRRARGTAAELLARLEAKGVLGGIDLGRFDPSRSQDVLVAVTEKHDRAALDRFVQAMADAA